MGRWGQEREWRDDVRNRACRAVAERMGWAREGEVLSPRSRVAGWAREGASEGEGREREKTGVGTSGLLRGGGRGQGHMLSNGRSVVVLPSTWHRHCCIIVVRWTQECTSTRWDETAQCAQSCTRSAIGWETARVRVGAGAREKATATATG